MTKIISVGTMRGVEMEGELADKPHIWLRKRGLLVLFVSAVLLLFAADGASDKTLSPEPSKAQPYAEQIIGPPLGLTPRSVLELDHRATQKQIAEIHQALGDEGCGPVQRPHNKVSPSVMKKKSGSRDHLHIIIEQVAMRHNVDPALIKAIIMAESGYNPNAVSKKGAIGLMQLMPKTAHELGVKELFDPEDNVEAGVRYFKRLLRRFGGNVRLALAAYNAGSTKVRRYRGIPPIGATRYYVRKVFHYYKIYKRESTVRTDDA